MQRNNKRIKNNNYHYSQFPQLEISNSSSLPPKSRSSLLVPDVLEEIFSSLAETEHSTVFFYDQSTLKNLYSCMLVCRKWSQSAVRILWKKPFGPFHDKGFKIITSLLKGLGHQERKFLRSHGVKLPSSSTAATATVASPLPLFNYPSFVKHLEYSEMLYSVEQWCLALPKSKKKSKIVIPIMKVLLRLFLHNAGPLHSLKLSSLGENYDDEKLMILAEPQITPLISCLKNLSLDGFDHNQNGLLTRLPDLCQNLEFLSLRGWYSNKPYDDVPDDSAAISLSRIIKSQKYLISLDLFDCKTYIGYIISALVSQSVSLRNVYFRFVDFDDCGPWDGLASCMNLKNLEFWFCEGITDKMINPLLNSDLSDLEQVKLLYHFQSCGCDNLKCWAHTINGTKPEEEDDDDDCC